MKRRTKTPVGVATHSAKKGHTVRVASGRKYEYESYHQRLARLERSHKIEMWLFGIAIFLFAFAGFAKVMSIIT